MSRRRLSFLSLLGLFLWIAIFLLLPGSSSLPSPNQIMPQFNVYDSEGLTADTDGPLPSILGSPGLLEEFLLDEVARVSVQGAHLQVNFIGEWTAEQKTAMNYAAFLWSKYVYSPLPIGVDAEWRVLSPGLLGRASFIGVPVNHPNAPHDNTIYPVSLANAIRGKDMNFNSSEIWIQFNPTISGGKDFSWYYGIDGKTPTKSWDFVSVAMHEIGHGLLGVDSFSHDYEKQITGWGGGLSSSEWVMPNIFDWYFANSSGQRLMDTNVFPNPSQQLFNQFTPGNIHFRGPQTLENNGSQGGTMDTSSKGHMASSYKDSPNALMAPSLSNGTARHHPGPIVLGMLADIGWGNIARENTAPVIRQLPMLLLEKDKYYLPRLDMWAYTTDTHSLPSELAFSITNSPAAEAGVSLRSNRYIDIEPTGGWVGETRVTVKVQDPEGLSSTTTFSLLVLEKVYQTLLPSVRK
jgi:hypothetical protein